MTIISLRSTCWSTDTLWRLLESGYKSPLFGYIDEEENEGCSYVDLKRSLFPSIFQLVQSKNIAETHWAKGLGLFRSFDAVLSCLFVLGESTTNFCTCPRKRKHLRVTDYTKPACRCRANSGTWLDDRTRQCSAATSTTRHRAAFALIPYNTKQKIAFIDVLILHLLFVLIYEIIFRLHIFMIVYGEEYE